MASESVRPRDRRRLETIERVKGILGPRASLETTDRAALRLLVEVIEDCARELAGLS